MDECEAGNKNAWYKYFGRRDTIGVLGPEYAIPSFNLQF